MPANPTLEAMAIVSMDATAARHEGWRSTAGNIGAVGAAVTRSPHPV